jgi:hypothetical protein
MKARLVSRKPAPAFPPAKRAGSVPALGAPAAVTASLSRRAPCSRRSGSNHPMRDNDPDWPDAPARPSYWIRFVSGRMWPATAAPDRLHAYGQTKRPSALQAQTAPAAQPIGSSSETNSFAEIAPAPRLPHFAPVDKPCRNADETLTKNVAQLRRFFDGKFLLVAITAHSAE